MASNFLKSRKFWLTLFVVILLSGLGIWLKEKGYVSFADFRSQKEEETISLSQEEIFTQELYNTVKEKYWDSINDDNLSNLFLLATKKATGTEPVLASKDLGGVLQMVSAATANKETKVELVAQIGDLVLANLQPFGRSRLFTQTQTQELVNTVINKDENSNLYAALGVDQEADSKKLESAYNAKRKELSSKKDEASIQQLALIERAWLTLKDEATRKNYNEKKTEATVEGKEISKDIFYVRIIKFSPVTLDEFVRTANSTQDKTYTSLILDLRGNIGGAIDILPYFLGPFIGPDRYAYDFYRKGEYIPYKTKTGWLESLVKFKKVIVLTDNKAQSSAEVMAATLKKYNVGILIGTPTKGWGTVEQLIPLQSKLKNNTYTAVIVQSLTVADDNQQIEGRGVSPHISITDPKWADSLRQYYPDNNLIKAVKDLVSK